MKTIIEEAHLEWDFAIIEKSWVINAYLWETKELYNLSELESLQNETKQKVVFITPFSLATTECNYETNTDNEPILAMLVENELEVSKNDILAILDNKEINIWNISPSISDELFEKQVEKVQNKIIAWEVNQMILSRKFDANIEADLKNILRLYSKLLDIKWPYMNFLFSTRDKAIIWSSPERHLSIHNNTIGMNPIAWTLPKLDFESFNTRLFGFLVDSKETEELCMVIDEELKMMLNMSESWKIRYPLIKESWAVIHTEWELIGRKKQDLWVLDAFRNTMYAPTLVWWPIESAFKQIKEFENDSRWYYGWAFWIYDKDFLDTCIVIRTAFIDKLNNILSVRAGAWIVKDSNPKKEVVETIMKANGFLGIFNKDNNLTESYLDKMDIWDLHLLNDLLKIRSKDLNEFYFNSNDWTDLEVGRIKIHNFLLINFWDDFVNMSAFMIKKMWWRKVDVIDYKDFDINNINEYDYVMVWPGYWDINNETDERISSLLNITWELLETDKKILWICLGYQAICKLKWYDIVRQDEITQWVQKTVNLDWEEKVLWFYNSYSPVAKWVDDKNVEIFENNRVLTYNTENISSIQAHPESIMSVDWFEVLKDMILKIR